MGEDLIDEELGEVKTALSPFPAPDYVTSAAMAVQRPAFRLDGGLVHAWFERRSPEVLLVTFDNLVSIGEYDPPQPWAMAISARLGYSVLGIMASRKDWYRNEDAPRLITELEKAGLFKPFRRVVFCGVSMGGFAASVFSRLVPGAAVLAFSPQSTLSKKIAPFEKRYHYAQRKWDWSTPPFLDAAAEILPGTEIWVPHDPHLAEDRAHAQRLPGARIIRLPHLGHRAIRKVKAAGALDLLFKQVAEQSFDAAGFARLMRARREDPVWQRALLSAAEAKGHPRLAARAARIIADMPGTDAKLRKQALRLAGRQAPPAPAASPPLTDRLDHVLDPMPEPPFTGAIAHLHGALVLPERDGDQKLASGVLTAQGDYVELSRAWIRARKSTPAPVLLQGEEPTFLPGRHLFAGHLRGHFGHFLVESTARLWALDHIGQSPDSILYLPYRGAHPVAEATIRQLQPFFDILDIKVPIRTHPGTLEVEELILPELGFGWLERYAGSPAYRAFMQTRLRGAAASEGGEKLYVSRAQLNSHRGGILGEDWIERNLARAGFEIFHPERHPLTVQIARYKAARTIVALDGSALHLAAYVAHPTTKVAMILRRSSANVADYLRQFASFAGIAPAVINAIRRDWVSSDANRADFRSVGELDFAALFDRLVALGHLPQDFRPDLPASDELAAALSRQSDKRGATFRALERGEAHPDDAEE